MRVRTDFGIVNKETGETLSFADMMYIVSLKSQARLYALEDIKEKISLHPSPVVQQAYKDALKAQRVFVEFNKVMADPDMLTRPNSLRAVTYMMLATDEKQAQFRDAYKYNSLR